jgi:hypothetical protein
MSNSSRWKGAWVLSCLVACGGVSAQAPNECDGGASSPRADAGGVPVIDASTSDAEVRDANPTPSGTVSLVEATTVTSMQRSFSVPLPKARAVGDLIVAVWRAPTEPSTIAELDDWSVVTQTQVGVPGNDQFLWVATRRITTPPSGNDQDVFFHSGDGYQEMTFLLYRGARAVEPLTPVRTVTTWREGVKAPFATVDGRLSRAIYLVTAPGSGAWSAVPAGYRKTSESAEVIAFESLAMLPPASAEAPALRLRAVPELVTAFAAAIVAE